MLKKGGKGRAEGGAGAEGGGEFDKAEGGREGLGGRGRGCWGMEGDFSMLWSQAQGDRC